MVGDINPGDMVIAHGQGCGINAWFDLFSHRVGDVNRTPDPDFRLDWMEPATVICLADGNWGYKYALLLARSTLAWDWIGHLRRLDDVNDG